MTRDPKTTGFRLLSIPRTALTVFVAATIGVQFFADRLTATALLALTLGGIVGAIISLGVAITGQALGVVIDNRNRVSLSKLQMLLWTILVVGGMAAGASEQIAHGAANPLDLGIPWELLAAMGISAAALVGAPAVLSPKLDQTPSAQSVQDAQVKDPELEHSGKVATRKSDAKARFSDLFTGDEISNANSPDLTKIQSFAITVLLIGVYLAAMVASFTAYFDPHPGLPHLIDVDKVNGLLKTVAAAASNPSGAATPAAAAATAVKDASATVEARKVFPPLSTEFLWLMGISHTAYLAYKAAPHGGDAAESSSDDSSAAHVHALG